MQEGSEGNVEAQVASIIEAAEGQADDLQVVSKGEGVYIAYVTDPETGQERQGIFTAASLGL